MQSAQAAIVTAKSWQMARQGPLVALEGWTANSAPWGPRKQLDIHYDDWELNNLLKLQRLLGLIIAIFTGALKVENT